jgi:TolB-like protein
MVFTKDTMPQQGLFWAMSQARDMAATQQLPHPARPPVAQQPGSTTYHPSTSPPQQSSATSGSGNDLTSQLSRLADMHVQGILTDFEFAEAKAKVLRGM